MIYIRCFNPLPPDGRLYKAQKTALFLNIIMFFGFIVDNYPRYVKIKLSYI